MRGKVKFGLAVTVLALALGMASCKYLAGKPEDAFGKTVLFSLGLGSWDQWPASWDALAKQARGLDEGVPIDASNLEGRSPLALGSKVLVIDANGLSEDKVKGFRLNDATDMEFDRSHYLIGLTFELEHPHPGHAVYILPAVRAKRYPPAVVSQQAMSEAELKQHWQAFESAWDHSRETIPSDFSPPTLDCLNLRGDEGKADSEFRGFRIYSHCLKDMLPRLIVEKGRKQHRWKGTVIASLGFEDFDSGIEWHGFKLGSRFFYCDEIQYRGAFQLGPFQYLQFWRGHRGTEGSSDFFMKCRNGHCEEIKFPDPN